MGGFYQHKYLSLHFSIIHAMFIIEGNLMIWQVMLVWGLLICRSRRIFLQTGRYKLEQSLFQYLCLK